ncbi:MAG: creatininase family protein [Opitutaceae bacterium]|nr:creatininase family protein [Opitutaceae bacterium]
MSRDVRHLASISASRIRALPDRAWAPVVLLTGAIEQHGPHLPVAFDALIAQVWIERILARLPADATCYVAPSITIGKSNEHIGFPGTLTISQETLRGQIHAIARQLAQWGFRQLAVLNTHGGNSGVLGYTLRELEPLFGLRATRLTHAPETGLSPQEATYGFHAGEVETSWLLAAAPSLVRPHLGTCEYPAHLSDPGELRPEDAPATFAWASQDVSRSGVMGDATAASAEKGARWIEQRVDGYVAQIVALADQGRRRIAADA